MTNPIPPITQGKPDLRTAVRMAVAEIEHFLSMFYPVEVIRRHESAKAIAGQWLSRVQGFHDEDDFLYLVRDFLAYILSGANRSFASDRLSLFFSGFMPSHGAARTFWEIVNDGGQWFDVRAFMHSQAYGNAREYVEQFDWSAGRQKAQEEATAWLKVIQAEDVKLNSDPSLPLAAGATASAAFAPALPAPAGGTALTGVASRLASRLASTLATVTEVGTSVWIAGIGLMLYSPDAGDPDESQKLAQWEETVRKQRELAAQAGVLVIAGTLAVATVAVNTQRVSRQAQLETNKVNGQKCEGNGYAIMEKDLHYAPLTERPQSKGLDGLFEKTGPLSEPPFPLTVSNPKGTAVFIPATTRPPPYPRFVVLEAKNIAKSFDPSDEEGIKKAAKQRLSKTDEGTVTQMSHRWIIPRVPQSLDRNVRNGTMTEDEFEITTSEIRKNGYARWIFVCLPSAIGSPNIFVFIDVDRAALNIDRKKPEKPPQQTSDTGFH